MLEKLIEKAQKPMRYTGGEYGTAKLKTHAKCNFCLCFPDTYEVALSNLAIRMLYFLLNDTNHTNCELCFMPGQDFYEILKQKQQPLFSLQTKTPLANFDMLGFSFSYELSYTNFLAMLDGANIPLRSKDRTEKHPIIMGGGPCTVNPIPLAAFVDLFVIGDGEEAIEQLTKLYGEVGRKEFLKQASKIQGVYVPGITKGTVKKATVKSLENAYFPTKCLIANTSAVHDRAVVEIFRGCTNGCRFCQAGYIYRPYRARSVDKIVELTKQIIKQSGYNEVALSSLSTTDYPQINELIEKLKDYSISLPSLRLNNFAQIAELNTRITGLTFAPEAGTQRLRDIINKNITDEDIITATAEARKRGFKNLKLYFIIGLPFETQEDINGIVEIAKKVKKGFNLTVSTSVFIPKPHTPFFWSAVANEEDIKNKQMYLKIALRNLGVKYIYHDIGQTYVETLLARGGEESGDILETAYKNGCVMDAWSEFFKFDKWNIDTQKVIAPIPIDASLPFDFIDIGVSKTFLLNELEKAQNGIITPSGFKSEGKNVVH